MPWDDDDDWVGTPPEGRHSADKADPEYWRRQRPPQIALAAIVVVLVVIVLVKLIA